MKRRIGMVMSVIAFVIGILFTAGIYDGHLSEARNLEVHTADMPELMGTEGAEQADMPGQAGTEGAEQADMPGQTGTEESQQENNGGNRTLKETGLSDAELSPDAETVPMGEEAFGEHAWGYDEVMDVAEEYRLFQEDWWVPCVDEEVFEVIRDAYAGIDFMGEFETGEPEVYEEYRRKFWRLLEGEGRIVDRETGKACSIFEFLQESFSGNEEEYDPEDHEYTYYLYDINGDGCPELGIREGRYLTYFLYYDKEADSFGVWCRMEGYRPLGVRKGMYSFINELTYSFDEGAYMQLDENAHMACSTYFFSEEADRGETLYMVMLPVYADKTQEVEVTQAMREQGVYIRSAGYIQSLEDPVTRKEKEAALCADGQWFFRVTKEQYAFLTDAYMESFRKWNRERCGVQYSYEALFGDLMQAASGEGGMKPDQRKMTQREAVDVLLHHLYGDSGMIVREDPSIYECNFLTEDFENSQSMIELVYGGLSEDGLYCFFSVMILLYDDLDARYENDFYRSSYVGGFAVNRETGAVIAEREQDEDSPVWELNEEYQRIRHMGQDNG